MNWLTLAHRTMNLMLLDSAAAFVVALVIAAITVFWF